MAAERLSVCNAGVTVFDHMPAFGRKFLMAGRGGLNLTHSEPTESLRRRYRPAGTLLDRAITDFGPADLVAWCEGLGIETFVGSSGRIFPRCLKASPLLRAWLGRLSARGVAFRPRYRWQGITADGRLQFDTPEGGKLESADATLLALGGASWPRLGSDGTWPPLLPEVAVTPFAPSNMGFRVAWSPLFSARHAGAPLKRIAITHGTRTVKGEAIITTDGIEGGAVYALSAALREAIASHGHASIAIDLRPDLTAQDVAGRLAQRSRAETVTASLRKAIGLTPVAIGLVQEALHGGADRAALAELVKALPLALHAPQPITRAISSAGGIAWAELDDRLMLRRYPGFFACGEMLDWEAPTGGYLLQGCFSTAVMAAEGAATWLRERER